VNPPVTRTPGQSSGSTPPVEDCSGQYALDFNDWIQTSGDPSLVAGAVVYAQYWSRDPATRPASVRACRTRSASRSSPSSLGPESRPLRPARGESG
jgi:hypothetical protein